MENSTYYTNITFPKYIIQNIRIWCYIWIVFVVDSVPDVSSGSKASNWTESQRNCKLSNFQAKNATDMCERKRGSTETGMWTNIFRVEISSHSDYGKCYFSEYIANSSWNWGSYGSIWTGPLPKMYYMDRSFCYCHMTRSDMNYLLYYTFYLK
jgi:hypothetical protein